MEIPGDLTQAAPVGPESTSLRADDAIVAGRADHPTPTYREPPPYLDSALEDAERLLKYAAEIGIEVDEHVRDHVLQARTQSSVGWSEQGAANLLAALTTLAALLRPVTAESLKACSDDTQLVVRDYWQWAMWLAAIIVPLSLFGFVTSAISESMRGDIVTANDLAVKLTSQLHPQPPPPPTQASAPPAGLAVVEVVTELQQFASIIRQLDGRARQLHLLFRFEQDPSRAFRDDPAKLHERFQLPRDLPNHLVEAADDRIQVYQDVRYFAQNLMADSSFVFGAIMTYLLPVLYALLGTCAYLLRSFEQEMKIKTFIPSAANSARFLIAGIGGGVVGLFNNFTIPQGTSIPPLAIAFLVGYAVDVFFSFLEGLLQAFTKTRSGASAPASGPVSGSKA